MQPSMPFLVRCFLLETMMPVPTFGQSEDSFPFSQIIIFASSSASHLVVLGLVSTNAKNLSVFTVFT